MNINCTSKKSKCVCSGRGAPNTDEEGGKLEKLIPDYIAGVHFESYSYSQKKAIPVYIFWSWERTDG